METRIRTIGLFSPPPGLTEITLAGIRIDVSYTSGSRGYADVGGDGKVSLSSAIQPDGSPVDLPFIDFVKIVTAVHDVHPLFGERSTETRVPKDLNMADPNQQLFGGWDMEKSQYYFTFMNYSGYDLTVEILEGGGIFELAKGTSANPTRVEKFSDKANIYFEYSGGNVNHTASGAVARFYDGDGNVQ